jgi:hypothetical protein
MILNFSEDVIVLFVCDHPGSTEVQTRAAETKNDERSLLFMEVTFQRSRKSREDGKPTTQLILSQPQFS